MGYKRNLLYCIIMASLVFKRANLCRYRAQLKVCCNADSQQNDKLRHCKHKQSSWEAEDKAQTLKSCEWMDGVSRN